MKWLNLFLPLLLALGLCENGFALSTRSVCFDIMWQASGVEGGPSAKQKDGSQRFISINDSAPIEFLFDQSQDFREADNGVYTLSHSMGCTDASNFEIGANKVKMFFNLGDGVPLLNGIFKVTVDLLLPNHNRVVIGDDTFYPDANKKTWGFDRTYTATLNDIAPDVFAKTEEFEGKIQTDVQEIGTLNQTIDVDLANYSKVFDVVKDKSFFGTHRGRSKCLSSCCAKIRLFEARYS